MRQNNLSSRWPFAAFLANAPSRAGRAGWARQSTGPSARRASQIFTILVDKNALVSVLEWLMKKSNRAASRAGRSKSKWH